MSGLDRREMLSSAAGPHTWRSGWAEWGDDDARPAALPARSPPPPPLPRRRPAAADRRGEEGSGRVWGRREEGTNHGGSGARRVDAAVAPARTGDAAGTGRNAVAISGGSATSGAERVAARVEDGRRSMDGPTLELSEMMLHAVQPWTSRCTQRGARPDAAPPRRPPPRPVAADGRGEGTGRARGRGEDDVHGGSGGGAEREGAVVAPARNAVAVAGGLATHGGERVAGPVVAKEEKRNGGGGGGQLGTKRGLEERAALPPPKRRAVSAKRQFPPDFGRDSAVPLGRGRGRDGGVRPSDEAPARAVLGVVEKVASVDNGDSMANVHHHAVMDTVLMRSSHASDENQVACKVGAEGAAMVKGQLLGKKEVLAQAVNLLPKRRIVSATHRFPAGCGRDAAAPLARREEGKVGSCLEVMPVDVGGGVSKEVMATDGSKHSVNQCTTNIVGAVGVLDGTVQCQELEEGEVADEAYCDVESQKVAGYCSLDDSAGERHEGVVPVTSAVTEVLTSHAYDDMMQIKALQEGAVMLRRQLKMTCQWEANVKLSYLMLLLNVRLLVLQMKLSTALGSNGMKGEVSSLAIEDHGGIAQVDQKLEDVEMTTGEYRVQDAQVATHVILHESTTGRHEGGICASAAAEDVKVMNKYKGTLPKAAAKPWAEGPSKQHLKGQRECEIDRVTKSSMNVATGVFGHGIMRNKILSTARKAVKPPVRASHKPPLNTLHRPFSKGKEEPAVTNSASFGPKKKLKVKGPGQSKDIPMKIASTSGLAGKVNLSMKRL